MTVTREPSLFIQFAGQGTKYMDELRRLYNTSPALQPFIQDAIAEIKHQAAQYDDSQTGFFSQGLAIDRWIDSPAETPDIGYLLSSPLSHPLIFLCQISTYISILQTGINPEKLIANTHSTTGFSTGVVAAVLASMGLSLDALLPLALRVQAMFFWQGVRCQESLFRFNVQSRLHPELLETPEGSPSCMAGVNNLTRDQLERFIQAFAKYGVVYTAYEVLPDRCIVAGLPETLAAFGRYLSTQKPDAALRFIPSTIAAHSPYLDYALDTSPEDARRVGLVLNTEMMKIPVWSNDTGDDLRHSQDIIRDIMQAYFTRPAVWHRQIAPLLKPSSITHVIDFGPGPGVAGLTESYTAGCGIKVIRCSVPIGRKLLVDELLPTLC